MVVRHRLAVPASLAVAAVALRLPQLLASRHLSFDDGVFGASAVAMRHGGVPFRDIFSSQGPVFLPLVWLFDAAGGRTSWSPRLLALTSGVLVTLAVWSIARRLAGARAGVLAAVVVTASGSMLWTTAPLAADGPGLALAVSAVAVALAYRDRPRTALAVAVGLLAGAAFAVKSIFAVPPGLAVAWVFLESRRWRDVVLGVAASAAVVLGAAVPFGLGDVWDQAVAYHLEAAGDRTPLANARRTVTTLWDRDLLLFVSALAAGIAMLRRRRQPDDALASALATPRRWGGPLAPVGLWAVAVAVVLVAEHPMWRPHVTHLVPPLTILATAALVPLSRTRVVLAGALVALVAHAVTVAGIVWRADYDRETARVVSLLKELPPDALAISDDPGLVWRAGLRPPHDLVDTSRLRIDTERLTAESVSAEAARADVCAVVAWESRHHFARLDLGPRLEGLGYVEGGTFSDFRTVWLRPACMADGSVLDTGSLPRGRDSRSRTPSGISLGAGRGGRMPGAAAPSR